MSYWGAQPNAINPKYLRHRNIISNVILAYLELLDK